MFDRVLRAEHAGGRDVPRGPALPHRRRIHRPLKIRAILSRTAVQRQPHATGRNDSQAHRWVFGSG